jgi:hypothetical protein
VTGRDVPDRDMPNFLGPGHRDVPIGDTSLAALLAGTQLPPGSAPELRPLAEALAGLRAQPAGDELQGEAQTLAAFRSQFGAARTAHRPPARTPPPRRRLVPVKAAAAAATVLSLTGIATAAYAGALPAAVQRLAHHIIAAPAPGTQPAISPSPAGPGTTGDRAYGLCTAWAHAKAHGTRKQRAAAFSRLAAAAGGAGKVTAYCAMAAPPGRSPSQPPQPSPTPRRTGRPAGLPAPHGSGQPSGLPAPQGTGTPTVRPTPHSTGKPSGLPTPRSSGH